MRSKTIPKRQCVKAEYLRKVRSGDDGEGYDNLRDWLENPKNLLICRHGRIFIKEVDGTNTVFHYPASKWANPYKLPAKPTLADREECIQSYEDYVIDSENTQNGCLLDDLHELKGLTLGCFCLPHESCHGDRLIQIYEAGIGELPGVE
jgi:hypothetical protein